VIVSFKKVHIQVVSILGGEEDSFPDGEGFKVIDARVKSHT